MTDHELQDIKVNSRMVKVHIGNGSLMNKPWKELVEDIVKVEKDQYFQAIYYCYLRAMMMVFVTSETMNLVGETNLKPKRCL